MNEKDTSTVGCVTERISKRATAIKKKLRVVISYDVRTFEKIFQWCMAGDKKRRAIFLIILLNSNPIKPASWPSGALVNPLFRTPSLSSLFYFASIDEEPKFDL